MQIYAFSVLHTDIQTLVRTSNSSISASTSFFSIDAPSNSAVYNSRDGVIFSCTTNKNNWQESSGHHFDNYPFAETDSYRPYRSPNMSPFSCSYMLLNSTLPPFSLPDECSTLSSYRTPYPHPKPGQTIYPGRNN